MNRARLEYGILAPMTLLLVVGGGCASEWEEQAKNPPMTPAGQKAACPKLSLSTLILEPCCTADNRCGGDATAVGYGCQPLDDPMFRSYLTNPPGPITCDGKPLSGSTGGPAAKRDGGMGARRDAGADAVRRDESCPTASVMDKNMQGCCTAGNECGVDASEFGFGCAPLSDDMLRALATDPPDPRDCDFDAVGPSVGQTRDAGRDAGKDAGRDAGKDAGRDAGKDAGRSASF